MSWQKSLVGDGVFTHEAGIHVDGLLKNRLNYQGIDPGTAGTRAPDHPGQTFRQPGRRRRPGAARALETQPAEVAEVLSRLRSFVGRFKRAPGDMELRMLHAEAVRAALQTASL